VTRSCAGCGDVVDDDPQIEVAGGRLVCGISCAYDVLAAAEVAGGDTCLVCGEHYESGRTPAAEGYDREVCARCAREVERREPRRSTA